MHSFALRFYLLITKIARYSCEFKLPFPSKALLMHAFIPQINSVTKSIYKQKIGLNKKKAKIMCRVHTTIGVNTDAGLGKPCCNASWEYKGREWSATPWDGMTAVGAEGATGRAPCDESSLTDPCWMADLIPAGLRCWKCKHSQCCLYTVVFSPCQIFSWEILDAE